MTFKKLFQKALLGLALSTCLLFGLNQNMIVAATLAPTVTMPGVMSPPVSETLPNVELGVDQFLKSIPAGYYTVGSVEGLKSLVKTRQPLLVDVRESAEYRSGHIPEAINIPLRTLPQNLAKIPLDRPVVLYCSTGYRSAMGVMTLHLFDYDNVLGFPPSFSGWQAAGEAIAQ